MARTTLSGGMFHDRMEYLRENLAHLIDMVFPLNRVDAALTSKARSITYSFQKKIDYQGLNLFSDCLLGLP